MAVRAFNGSTDYLRAQIGGDFGHGGSDGSTTIIIGKLTGSAGGYPRVYIRTDSTNAPAYQVLVAPGRNLSFVAQNYCESSGLPITEDVWGMWVMRHSLDAVGDVLAGNPRISIGEAGGAMAHANIASGSAQPVTQVGGSVYFGCGINGDGVTEQEFFPGELALVIPLDYVIEDDADIDALFGGVLGNLLALTPVEAWPFDQEDVTTAVEDLIAGLDQTERSGTTVVTGDDPPSDVYAGSGTAPTVDTEPTVTGAPEIGGMLTRTNGIYTGSPSPSVDRHWYVSYDSLDGVDDFLAGTGEGDTWDAIGSEAGLTLDVTADLYNGMIFAGEIATNTEGEARAADATSLFVYAVSCTAIPVVTGTPTEGETLSTTNGTWIGTPTLYEYSWLRDSVTEIPGATSNTYELTSDDVGFVINSRVTASDADDLPEIADSEFTATVEAAGGDVPVNSVAPVVTGTVRLGRTLSCGTGTWSNTPTGYAYQWQRDTGSGFSNIGGATASTRVLAVADLTADIRCLVTASNAEGDGDPEPSNEVGPVEGNSALILNHEGTALIECPVFTLIDGELV